MQQSGRLSYLLDPATKGWAIVAAGSASRLALGFVASVLIARALGPAAFGVYALLAATSNIGAAVADAGLSDSAVKAMASCWAQDRETAGRRASVFFWLKLGTSSTVFLTGILVSGWLSQAVFGSRVDPTLIALTLLGVVATAATGSLNSMLQATAAFGRITMVLLFNSGLTLLLAVALLTAGQLNLVTAIVVLGIATSVASFPFARRLLPPGLSPRLPSSKDFCVEARPLLRFGAWLWLSAVFAMLAAQLDLLLVNRWSDPIAVGAYGLAVNLAAKVDVLNQSLYTVLLPAASALRAKDTGQFVRRNLLRSSLAGILLLPLLPLAEPFIHFFYGPAYAAAVPLFQLLLGVVVFDLFTSPLLLLAFTFNQPKLLAGADALRMAAVGISASQLIPLFGPAGAILARLLARFLGALLVLCFLGIRFRRVRQGS